MDFLDSLLNNIDEAIIITDNTGKILFFNEPAHAQNFSLEVTKPLRVDDYLYNVGSPKRRKALQTIIREVNVKKQPTKSFIEFVNRDGTTVYLDLSYIPVLNEEKNVTHIYIFSRDITPQKVYERKLTTQSVNMSNLIERANAVIIGIDTLGYITNWNEHCVNVTGFTKIEAYARKLSDLVGGDINALNTGDRISQEVQFMTKSGKALHLLLSSTPLKTPKGEIIGRTLVGQDITELIGYRQSLERKVQERTSEVHQAVNKEREAIEMKSRFVSMASHELRSPLTTIQYATDFLRMHADKIGPADVAKRAEVIDRQLTNMIHLLDDLLLYSKAESGNFRVKVQDVALNDFLMEAVDEVLLNTKQTHEIIRDFHKIPETITADEKLLRNITINLLSNAIKYSPGKTTIEFVVRQYAGDLILIVKDQGMGIPENDMQTLFEPFRRGAAVGQIQGTGLGLSIVQKAVELLKGTIEVSSKVGEGSTFTVTLPLE